MTGVQTCALPIYTLEQVDVMTAQAEKEKSMQQKAFDILFGGVSDDEE